MPTMYNEGVGGRTLTVIDTNFTEATEHSPDVILIQGGTNDVNSANPNTAMQTAVESMVAKTIAVGATPVLVNIPPKSGVSATTQGYIDTHNTWISGYATTEGLELADVNIVLNDGSDDIIPEYDSGDGVHLSTAGYKVMGDAVADAVQTASPF